MKELEKTKSISIASVLFILVIIIGLLAYKRPKHLYTENTKSTLEKITSNNYFISLKDINTENSVLIDVRNKFEFEKGHLENAINVDAPEILNEKNSNLFETLKNETKTIVMYGASPSEVIVPFMVLHQLGYTNIKIVSANINYKDNKLISNNVEIEKSTADIKAFIQESINNVKGGEALNAVIVKKPKKIIPIKKKKKSSVEGGC